uniref:NfeD family protein n=1 Tax=Thaumasiovibrio occultus TaxID=1891184 RepID=UPI000B361EFB|nr:NfeD family protein [Thaumasiovibrio occultus]
MVMLDSITYIHWLIVGLVLLGLELAGATMGYLLCLGLSALVVGLVKWIVPSLSWELQLISFAVFALFTTWLWWRYRKQIYREDNKTNLLNRRMDQLVGKTTRLEEAVDVGSCRIKLGDTYWSAKASTAIAAGSRVKVVDVDGHILTIEPVDAD